MSEQNFPEALSTNFQLLSELVKRARLPQVCALEASSGSGAVELLTALAKLILCDHQSACGQCPSCRRFEDGQQPDFVHLDAPDIDAIRILVGQFNTTAEKPAVVQLSGLENISINATNALLKFLEEPPKHVTILTSCRPEQVLPTITSRLTFLPLMLPPQSGYFADRPMAEATFDVAQARTSLKAGKPDMETIYYWLYQQAIKGHPAAPDLYFKTTSWAARKLKPEHIAEALKEAL